MSKPKHLCSHAGCRKLIDYDITYCPKHSGHYNRIERYTVDNKQYTEFYHSKAWRTLSHKILSNEPVCAWCLKRGIIRPAQIADHIVELKDDWSKRLDPNNIEPLCRACHNTKTVQERKKRQEKQV